MDLFFVGVGGGGGSFFKMVFAVESCVKSAFSSTVNHPNQEMSKFQVLS